MLWSATLAVLLAGASLACRSKEPADVAPAPTRAGSPDPAAGPRRLTLLSGPWRFRATDDLQGPESPSFDDTAWETVTVPHTWGAKHWKGGWYRTKLTLDEPPGERRLYLSFEGVAVYADVWVNGAHLGQHKGAFTRFLFDATPHLVRGANVVVVRADNHPESTVESLPSGVGRQLYHLYGGIYRKAWLVETGPVHVDPTDHAGPGVYLTPSSVTAESADLGIRVLVRNASDRARRVTVRASVRDPQGAEVAAPEGTVDLAAQARGEAGLTARIREPRRWGPGTPNLYTVQVSVLDGGQVVDAVTERTGLRDFRFVDRRFLLNGEPIALRGVGKHQETEERLSAVTDDDLRADFDLLADLGVNFVRLAHYPHARLAYDLADERGILVWAENGHSNETKVRTAGDAITREMVRQNYNHPSIVIWSVGNEAGFTRVNRYAEIVRADDPNRVIGYASNIGTRGKRRYPLLDLIAHNTYKGWYRGEPWDFEYLAVVFRYISENGGGSVVSHHTDYAAARRVVDAFEPEEYRQVLEEVHDQVVFVDAPDGIPMYAIWILRDFGTEKFKDVLNTKGLVTGAGFKKDAYYLYRSFLRPAEPLVHLTSKTYFLRRGDPKNGIKAYANRPELTLAVNGVPQGARRNGQYRHTNGRVIRNVFHWPVPLARGRNEVVVTDGTVRDKAVVYFDGPGASPGPPGPPPLVEDVRAANPRNRATFVDQPVQEQWPFYDEFDGTADNTFDRLPDAVRGAAWIATRRVSKPGLATALSFRVRKDARAAVSVLVSSDDAAARALAAAGFADTGTTGRWRANDLRLVPWRLFRKPAAGGEVVEVPALSTDAVVLVQKEGGV
jgi:beta-galactosidase